MKFNISLNYSASMWTVENRQKGNDWTVWFHEFDDAYNFLMEFVVKVGVYE